jgi:hypothetical protein
MRIGCSKCGAPLDAFDLKAHVCVPKEKLVSELTVTEFKALLEKEILTNEKVSRSGILDKKVTKLPEKFPNGKVCKEK